MLEPDLYNRGKKYLRGLIEKAITERPEGEKMNIVNVVTLQAMKRRKEERAKNPRIWDANYLEVKKARRDAINKKYGLKK